MSSPAAFGRSLKSGVSKSASSGTGWQAGRKRDSTDLRPFVLTQLAQPAEPSLRLDAGRLDHARVFPDFASHEYLEFLRGHVHGVVAQADEPVPHRRILQRLARVGRDLV